MDKLMQVATVGETKGSPVAIRGAMTFHAEMMEKNKLSTKEEVDNYVKDVIHLLKLEVRMRLMKYDEENITASDFEKVFPGYGCVQKMAATENESTFFSYYEEFEYALRTCPISSYYADLIMRLVE